MTSPLLPEPAVPLSVHQLRPSLEPDRPELDFRATAHLDWSALLAPDAPTDTPTLQADAPDAAAWDAFAHPGTLGVFSERVAQLVAPRWGRTLRSVRVRLEGRPYGVWVPREPRSCLDLDASDVTFFRTRPHRVKRVHRYVFDSRALPADAAFCIPESPSALFVTGSLRERLEGACLRGLAFERVWRA